MHIKNSSDFLYENNSLLKTILNFTNISSNIYLILENPNDGKIKRSLIQRLHLDNSNHIYSLEKNFNFKSDVSNVGNVFYLKKN